MENNKHNICREHYLPIAPVGPAMLVAQQDSLRIEELKLSHFEMEGMSEGRMAMRHFVYDTWCEDRLIAWL